jgi:hypothetical protein
MADSENSRTLPVITCANLLWATQDLLDEQIRSIDCPDRSLSSWNAWLDASRETARRNQQQQEIEDQIFEFRRAEPVGSSGGNGDVALAPDVVSVSSDHQLHLRHDHARQAELRASDREDDIADELFNARADTLLGSIAKLHCLLRREQPSQESDEHPWPEIRSVLADLLILNGSDRSVSVQV